MKVCIIGGGWVGCHLTNILKKRFNVRLFESSHLFSGTSFYNQNRLHLGYHYCRSYNTRKLCQDTFNRFIADYGHMVDSVDNNIYAIPLNRSLLDYNSYCKIFEDEDTHERVKLNILNNIEGYISVREKFIDPNKAKKYFTDVLAENLTIKSISLDDIEKLKNEYDLVINCTNNSLDPIKTNHNTYNEVCHSLIYRKKKQLPFGALTLVDGKFFSIYPYDNNNLFTLTDVEITPRLNLSIEERRRLMEKKVLYYFNDFLDYFEYDSFFTSKKVKYVSESDSRVPLIDKNSNYIRAFTGKIQGIYLIQDYIESL